MLYQFPYNLSQFQLLKVMLVFFSLVFPCFKDDVVQGQCGLHNGYFMQLEGNVGRVGWLTIRKISHFWQIGCIPLLQYAEFGFWHIGKCYFLVFLKGGNWSAFVECTPRCGPIIG